MSCVDVGVRESECGAMVPHGLYRERHLFFLYLSRSWYDRDVGTIWRTACGAQRLHSLANTARLISLETANTARRPTGRPPAQVSPLAKIVPTKNPYRP